MKPMLGDLMNAKGFTIDLLEFLASQSELLSGMSSVTLSTADNKQLQNIVMCLEALRNVIKNNAGVEMQCIGHFRLLFALLSAESCKDVQRGALEVIATVTRNHECVNDIAASDILVHLVVVLYTLPDHQVTILDILYALMSTTKIVKEALAKVSRGKQNIVLKETKNKDLVEVGRMWRNSVTSMVPEGCRAATFLHLDSEGPSTTIHLSFFQGGGSYGAGNTSEFIFTPLTFVHITGKLTLRSQGHLLCSSRHCRTGIQFLGLMLAPPGS
uniref:Uncharacterized protein n=1 Tax=Timema douglasi TaxID=61478 RepID=A0A7R8VGY1_TIMDO|nr:unnamed protein product [Timema douglasi]